MIASPEGAPKLVSASTTTGTESSEVYASGLNQQLFFNDFESGNASQWSVTNGTWNVVKIGAASAEYAATDALENDTFAGNSAWTDYSVEAYVRLSSIDGGRRGAVIVARERDAGHFYELEIVRESDGSKQWEMWRHEGSSWINLGHGLVDFTDNVQYLVRLAVVGSRLTASLARDYTRTFTTLGSANDSTYASGRVGLRAWGGMQATFDDVRVYGKTGSTAAPSPAASPSASASPTATSAPTSAPTVAATATPAAAAAASNGIPKRMLTFLQHVCYDSYCYYGTTGATPQQVASLVDYAQPNYDSLQTASTLRSLGVKTNVYLDPNLQYGDNDSLTAMGLPEDAFLHDCSGTRIKTVSGQAYVMDLRSPSLVAAVSSWSQQHAQGKFDAVFIDDIHAAVDFYENFSSPTCNVDRSSWDTATKNVVAATHLPFIFNSLSTTAASQPDSYNESIYSYPSVAGGSFELCYGEDSRPRETGDYWTATENSEIISSRANQPWICFDTAKGRAADMVDTRIYLEASLLLTYNPQSTIVETGAMTTSNGLPVYPETSLIALNPLVSTPSSVSTLSRGGAYVREYGACYIAGSAVGACAAVVNPSDSQSVPNPLSGYTTTLQLAGGNAFDGGTVGTQGGTPPSSLAPGSAFVAFKR